MESLKTGSKSNYGCVVFLNLAIARGGVSLRRRPRPIGASCDRWRVGKAATRRTQNAHGARKANSRGAQKMPSHTQETSAWGAAPHRPDPHMSRCLDTPELFVACG